MVVAPAPPAPPTVAVALAVPVSVPVPVVVALAAIVPMVVVVVVVAPDEVAVLADAAPVACVPVVTPEVVGPTDADAVVTLLVACVPWLPVVVLVDGTLVSSASGDVEQPISARTRPSFGRRQRPITTREVSSASPGVATLNP